MAFGNFFKSFLLDAIQKTGFGRRCSVSSFVAMSIMPYLAYLRNRNLAIRVFVPMLPLRHLLVPLVLIGPYQAKPFSGSPGGIGLAAILPRLEGLHGGGG